MITHARGSGLAALGRATRTALARLRLRSCDNVGENVTLVGRPSIHNRGRIEIGSHSTLFSRPVRASLASGPTGAIFVGERVTIGYGCSIVAEGLVMIGDGTQIGPFGILFDTDDDALTGWRRTSRPIAIGRDVRIGSKVTVLPGTYIGDGAEVASGSVVSGVIPAHAKVAGVPARSVATAGELGDATIPDRIAALVASVFDRKSVPLRTEPERLSGWDGEKALRLLQALESEFGIEISAQDWLDIRSFEDLVTIVERQTGARAASANEAIPPKPDDGGLLC